MKIVRGNHKPHITKQLRKAIMKRSQLKNKANKTKAPDDFASYKTQRNLVVHLNKEAKHTFFDSLDTSKDSKPFWDNCKPYFNNKSGKNVNDIMLLEENESVRKHSGHSQYFQYTLWTHSRFLKFI